MPTDVYELLDQMSDLIAQRDSCEGDDTAWTKHDVAYFKLLIHNIHRFNLRGLELWSHKGCEGTIVRLKKRGDGGLVLEDGRHEPPEAFCWGFLRHPDDGPGLPTGEAYTISALRRLAA